MKPSDNELVSRAQSGEVVAFEQLVRRYDRKVLSIALRFGRNEEDAKDMYQEAFIRIYRGLSGFRGKSQFSTWLYRVVTNVCLSYQRKSPKVKIVSLDSDETGRTAVASVTGGESPEKLFGDTEISRHVSDALATLPERQRLVFILRHFQDLKLCEIAETMNCAQGTVKRYLFLATRKLRVQLQDVYESR
jgi:RNA polymerase sigma-70 factor (ECF subfamily)